ncbi:MAG: hypothetical protein HY775_12880, partial [Acidobacteria bacterium]|nr:hypothetical protein [Acidobacteriota bacterium]
MNVFGKRGSTLVLLMALGAALAPAVAGAEALVRPHAEIVSPAMFSIAVGDGSSPVGVDVVWNQPLGDAVPNPVKVPTHYYLLVGRPWEFSRVYTETIQATSCTTIVDPNAPDVQRCSRHLDFPI